MTQGRLSVDLREADIRTILGRIGEQAGFSLIMESTARKTISVQFTDVELIQGLRRLLRLTSLNHTMVYTTGVEAGDALKELWVFPEGGDSMRSLPTGAARNAEAVANDAQVLQKESPTPGTPFLGLVAGQQQSQQDQQPEAASPPQKNPFMDLIRRQQQQ